MAKRRHPKTNLLRELGSHIQSLRRARGLSQVELAEHVGVEGETISRFERSAAAPSLIMLERIASALGTTVAELFLGASAKKSDQALMLDQLLSELNAQQRQLILEIAARQASFFKGA